MVEEIVIDRKVEIGDPERGKYIALEPSADFEIDYTLEYPHPVGREHVVYRHGGPETFRAEIAPARTFGFLKDIASLEEMGLASGGRLHNCILIGDDGVVNTKLRLESEFARHKILDIMGDLFLLGRPIRGSRRGAHDGTRRQHRAAAAAASRARELSPERLARK